MIYAWMRKYLWMAIILSSTLGAVLITSVSAQNTQCVVAPDPDLNNDGVVSTVDLFLVTSKFGLSSGSPGFDPVADTNCDGVVNINDVLFVQFAMGQAFPVPPANQAPVLNPTGNQTVAIGSSLSFTVTAQDPDGDAISLDVGPVPLPANVIWDGLTGGFSFTPALGQVGLISLTITASDGAASDQEVITIEVLSSSTGITTLAGQVLESGTQIPLENTTLSILGVTAVTDTSGHFFLNNLAGGAHRLTIDGSTAVQPGPYPTLFEEFTLIEGENNTLVRPIFLPILDIGSADVIDPTQDSMVTSSLVERKGEMFQPIELMVPAGTAINADTGELFTGSMSITPVEPEQSPVPIPGGITPSLYFAVQPPSVLFDPPVPISFPNLEGFEPGDEIEIFALNHNTGAFEIIGTGTVSADGVRIESDGGVVKSGSWHLFVPRDPRVDPDSDSNDDNQDQQRCDDCPVGSMSAPSTGNLQISHQLVTYRSLGISRGPLLVYNSLSADPRLIITGQSSLRPRTPRPLSSSTRLIVGGVQQGPELFSQSVSGPARQARRFDARTFATGRHPYILEVKCNFRFAVRTGRLRGQALVNNQMNSPFGAGWTLAGVQLLHPQSDGSMVLTDGDGSIMVFTPLGGGTFSSPKGDFSTLVSNADGTFTRTLKGGAKLNFDAQGLHVSTADRNGNTTTYVYDAAANLIGITDPVGLTTTLNYDSGPLTSITDPAGRITQFLHDTDWNLTTIIDPDGTSRSFTYDVNHLLTAQTDKRGFITKYFYDSNNRFVKSQLPDGSFRELESSQVKGVVDTSGGVGLSRTNLAPAVRQSDVEARFKSGNGGIAVLKTDRFGAITRSTDALGRTTSFQRDANSNINRVTLPNGSIETKTYDSRGNLLTTTRSGNTTRFTYDPTFNQITSITDPKGNTTQFAYDANGNLTQATDALGNITTSTYNSRGQLTSTTDPEGSTTTFAYDVIGNLPTASDPLGRTVILAYDTAGNIISSIDPLNRVTQFSYDSMNSLVSILDANSGVTSYTYDASGNLIQVTDAQGNPTSFSYDSSDRLVTRTDILGKSESFAYDNNNNLVSTTYRNGVVVIHEYDSANQLIKKVLPGAQVTTYAYDANGNLTGVTDPDSALVMTYDSLDRLSSTSTAGSPSQPNTTLTYAYDANDSRLTMNDPLGATRYSYDVLNRIVNLTNPNNQTTTFGYDTLSRRTSMVYPNSTVTNFGYDAASQLLSIVNQQVNMTMVGIPNGGFESGISTNFSSSGEVQLLQSLGPITPQEGTFMAFISTGGAAVSGRTSTLTTSPFTIPQGANDLSLDFNFLSNEFPDFVGSAFNDTFRVTLTTPTSSQTVDLASVNSSAFVSASGTGFNGMTGFQTFNFDVSAHGGELCTITLEMKVFDQGDSAVVSAALIDNILFDVTSSGTGTPATNLDLQYTYDNVGSRDSFTEPAGVHNYFYDDVNRLTQATHPQPENPQEDYIYDAVGNRISSGTVVAFAYNAANQLLSDDNFNYSYDANGNLTQKIEKGTGATTDYTYDAENQLARIDLPGGGFAEYRYDGFGRRIEKNINGGITRYVYDNEDILLEYDGTNVLIAHYTHGPGIDEPLIMERDIDGNSTFELGERFFYHADGLGSTVGLTDTNGESVRIYVYDSFGNIVSQIGSVPNPFTYTGREHDSESGLYYYRARYYNSHTGVFLQQDPIGFGGGNVNFYRYAKNNPVNFTDPSGLITPWDVLDVAFFLDSLKKFSDCPGLGTGGSLLLDTISLLPIIPSVGIITKIDDIFDATKGGLRGLGRAGKGKGVREVVGDAGDARKLFDKLRGSNSVTEVKPGVFTAKGPNGKTVTFRPTSKSGPPTVDVHGIEDGVRKIKFVDK